jgi:hypothetical protein
MPCASSLAGETWTVTTSPFRMIYSSLNPGAMLTVSKKTAGGSEMTTGLDVTSAGKLPGAVHLYIGEEAVAAGLEVVDTHQVGAAPER